MSSHIQHLKGFTAIPSVPSAKGEAITELRPEKNYPEHWVTISSAFLPGASESASAILEFQTSLNEGKSSFYFNVVLDAKATKPKKLFLKLIGEVEQIRLKTKGGAELSYFEIRQHTWGRAVAKLIARESFHLLSHPGEARAFGKDLLGFYRQSGWRGAKACVRRQLLHRAVRAKDSYDLWLENFGQLTEQDRWLIRSRIERLKLKPKISILMPVYNTDERWLARAIDSVREQLYENWELCIADDNSPSSHVKKVLRHYESLDPRIKVVYRNENGHISEASNSALTLVTGEFTGLLDHDDELSVDALYWMAEEINNYPAVDFLYSDEDKIDVHGRRFTPHIKMQWNPDLIYSVNFVTHFAVYRTSLLKEVGGFRKGYEGSQDYDLVLRASEKTTADRIRYVPHILYHWRMIPGSTAIGPESKSYALSAARRAIESHFERTGVKAKVVDGVASCHRVLYDLPEPLPLVSLIICTRDKVELLKQIVDGILKKTEYPNLELIIVDNQSEQRSTLEYLASLAKDSRVTILKYDAPFNFSAMNNFAVEKSRGTILGFLNNDLAVISGDWLTEMVRFASQEPIGAVGAKLYYGNETIQHAGVVLGAGGVAGHAHKYVARPDGGYMTRAKLIQGFSAVTGACLVVRKSLFLEVGGFDAAHLPVAFNDIDFCLKIRELGYRNVMTPYAELYHLESASRGSDLSEENRPRFERETKFMQDKWGQWLDNDPCYSPNLTLAHEDYGLAFPPRVKRPYLT